MNRSLGAYIGIEASISIVINALINGLIAYFIHRKSEYVSVDWLSLVIDIGITCLFIGAFNAPSAAASLKKNNASGVLPTKNTCINSLLKIFQKPVYFGLVAGLCLCPIIFALSFGLFSLIDLERISVWSYVLYKSAYTGLLGGIIIGSSLFLGMHSGTRGQVPCPSDSVGHEE